MNYDVIIATYNGEKYIVEQLESIIKQTVKPNNIFIRDDGSSDDTVKIINKFISSGSNELKIHFIADGTNVGYIKNFQTLSSLAISDIVFFSDQDDIWVNNKAEILMGKFDRNEDIKVVFSDAFLINNQKQTLGTLWRFINFIPSKENFRLEKILHNNFVTGATMAVKRDFLIDSIPFPENVPHDYWLACNAVIDSCLDCTHNELIYYRQHENNQIGAKRTSLINKITNITDKNKVNKRLGFYQQMFKLTEALEERGKLSEVEYNKFKDYLNCMNIIYNRKITNNPNYTKNNKPFCLTFFNPDYLKYKTIKSFLSDLIDSILLRAILKK